MPIEGIVESSASVKEIPVQGLRERQEKVRLRTAEETLEIPQAFVREFHVIRSPGELMSMLDVKAWDSIEDMFLSSIAFPGTNIMLVGQAGSSKTQASIRTLTAAYGDGQVRKVDTHIEDEVTLGVCDVPDLVHGKMATFLSDTSLIHYPGVILDEFNRAREEQKKIYMPLLSERTIMGHGCKALTVIGTMNPIGEAYNTEPLDPAAAERFSQVITVPDYHQVDEKHRLAILMAASTVGGYAVTPETRIAIRAAIAATMLRYPEIEAAWLVPLARYADYILMGAQQAKPAIQIKSARTGKTLVRNTLRLVAFRAAVYGEEPVKIMEAMARKALSHVSVSGLYDETTPEEKLEALHSKAKHFLVAGGVILGMIAALRDPLETVAALCSKAAVQLNEIDRSRLVERALTALYAKYKELDEVTDAEELRSADYRWKKMIIGADILLTTAFLVDSKVRVTDSALVMMSQQMSAFLTVAWTKGVTSADVLLTKSLLTIPKDTRSQRIQTGLPWEKKNTIYIGSLRSDSRVLSSMLSKVTDGSDEDCNAVLSMRIKHWQERRAYYDTF